MKKSFCGTWPVYKHNPVKTIILDTKTQTLTIETVNCMKEKAKHCLTLSEFKAAGLKLNTDNSSHRNSENCDLYDIGKYYLIKYVEA